MPWFSIIMALLAFFASKESGASNTKALVTAGLAGASSYYVTHETDWGKANLGALDGVATATEGAVPILDIDGRPVLDDNGRPVVKPPTSGGVGSNVADVLKSWGGAGTAAVVGTAAIATGGTDAIKAVLPWALGALALFLVIK